jgi:hypothetical protein
MMSKEWRISRQRKANDVRIRIISERTSILKTVRENYKEKHPGERSIIQPDASSYRSLGKTFI